MSISYKQLCALPGPLERYAVIVLGTDSCNPVDRRLADYIMKTTIRTLTARERTVIELRLGLNSASQPLTHKAIAEHFGVTRERIRQMAAKASRKLRYRASPFLAYLEGR